MKQILLSSLAASITFGMITACSVSKSDQPSGGLSRPPVTAAPTARSLSNANLPLNAYMLSGQEQSELHNARELLTRDCMDRFGIIYPVRRRNTPAPDLLDHGIYFWPLEKVRQYGYRVPEGNTLTPRDIAPRMTAAQLAVLDGIDGAVKGPREFKRATVYNGMSIPKDGCYGEAYRHLGITELENILDFRVQLFRAEAAQRADSDPKLIQGMATWSACMKQNGYDYRTPRDAVNGVKAGQGSPAPRDPSKPADQHEIQVAVTDMNCKAKVNYVGVMAAVRSAYEQQQVERHAEELKSIRKNIDSVMRNAADVLSGKN